MQKVYRFFPYLLLEQRPHIEQLSLQHAKFLVVTLTKINLRASEINAGEFKR